MARRFVNIRIDRLATLYMVSPLMRFASEGRFAIPILMYHSIEDGDQPGVKPYYRTTTSTTMFHSHMEYLHKNGYRACSPAEIVALLESSTDAEAKYVGITFDDGFQNVYREAFPVLSQFGFSATVYLPTSYIGDSTLRFNGRECLTWSEVRELGKAGITFGSHTVTHPQLSILSRDAIEREIRDSKEAIEEKIGDVVDSFAYPFAFPQTEMEFRRMLRESMRSAGYANGVCTTVGRARPDSDRFFMERLPVNSLDDIALFRAKLDGYYDWISRPQSFSKWTRSGATRFFGRREGRGGDSAQRPR